MYRAGKLEREGGNICAKSLSLSSLQLQDALRKKLTKCEHIDIDWGVGGEGEEEIYQTPTVDSVSVPLVSLVPGPDGDSSTFKRSETAGNLQDETRESKRNFVHVDCVLYTVFTLCVCVCVYSYPS